MMNCSAICCVDSPEARFDAEVSTPTPKVFIYNVLLPMLNRQNDIDTGTSNVFGGWKALTSTPDTIALTW